MRGGPFRYEGPEDLLEFHLARTSRGSRLIYAAVALLTITTLAALPLIEVDVYVSAPGIVRPSSEKHEVTVGVDGLVESASIRRGTTVERGQVLITIRARPTEARQENLAEDLVRAEHTVADLTYLLSKSGGWIDDSSRFRTIEHLQQARALQARLGEVDLRLANSRAELDRLEQQLESEIVAPVEVEQKRYELRSIEAQRSLTLEEARSRWAEALAAAHEYARGLHTQNEQLAEARALHEVRSPIGGSLEEVLPLSPGSFVRAGTRVAIVSPDAGLVGEILVEPGDIGLIRVDGPVLFRVHAFSPQEWGVLTGRVTSISGDVVDTGAGPVFRVRATLDRAFLELPAGIQGHLKKGMTFEARFLVARRSLFQLLRDRVHDWLLNPVTS